MYVFHVLKLINFEGEKVGTMYWKSEKIVTILN